jgi:mannose-1-phosphate guanylyltransferase
LLPALVLTAGLGTRLFPLTLTRAKPAAPVAGVPLVVRILEWLASQHVDHVVLNLHHLPSTITGLVGDGSQLGLRVRYSLEYPMILGSAGGPRHALPLLDRERFLIANGDTLTDVAAGAIVAEHSATGAAVTLAVVPNEEPDRYGGVVVEADGTVSGFTRRGDRRPSWHFVGVQVAEARVFLPLPENQPAESVAGLYRGLIDSQPGAVRAWRSEARFVDIGTPADYWRTSLAFADRERRPNALAGARCSIAPGARLTETVLWDDVTIGSGVVLERCVVADRAVVPDGSHYVGCAIAPATEASGSVRSASHIEGHLVVVPFETS